MTPQQNQYGQTYVGNDDFRGYLAANNGSQYLGFVGNDGGVDRNAAGRVAGSGQQVAGYTNTYGYDPNVANQNSQAVQNLYNQYNTQRQNASKAAQAGATQQSLYGQYGDPNALNSQIQGYQGDMGRLDAQYGVGVQNLNDQYQRGRNGLDEQNGMNERNYNQQTKQNVGTYTNQRSKIDQQTRGNANALQRLLGMAGSGNSSAAYEQAPYAAALQGSIDTGDAQQTYGTNQSNIDMGWQDAQKKYRNALDDLDTQRYQNENGLKASRASAQVDLYSKIADAAGRRVLAQGGSQQAALQAQAQYVAQMNALKDAQVGYGRANPNPVLAAQKIDTAPITLSDYAKGRSSAPQAQAAGGAAIDNTFLGVLNGGKKDQYGQGLLG